MVVSFKHEQFLIMCLCELPEYLLAILVDSQLLLNIGLFDSVNFLPGFHDLSQHFLLFVVIGHSAVLVFEIIDLMSKDCDHFLAILDFLLSGLIEQLSVYRLVNLPGP